MPWDENLSGIPKYAVEGGFYDQPIYFARAKIGGGLHVGGYYPNEKIAKIEYNFKECRFSTFEVIFS